MFGAIVPFAADAVVGIVAGAIALTATSALAKLKTEA
jgi:hypothetical protein